jgi:DNA-binding MarR family transcriptional regulator
MVEIELSPSQIRDVVRAAGAANRLSIVIAGSPVLNGVEDVRRTLSAHPELLQDTRLSVSLLVGLLILSSFPTDHSYIRVTDLSRALQMHPSKISRYVTTLVEAGLVERDSHTRRYRLAR